MLNNQILNSKAPTPTPAVAPAPNAPNYSGRLNPTGCPNCLVWIQCIAFAVLYAVWILPEIVGVRNTALVVGALASLYPIYQYRHAFWQRSALPVWLILGLFAWATFHLLFLAQDPVLQALEFKRIWKYAAIGAIFALGLGISLFTATRYKSQYWAMIYLGLALPVLIYLLKYILTTYGAQLGIKPPPYLQIYFGSQPYYVPKTDYVAFCLPLLAVALGSIKDLLIRTAKRFGWVQLFALCLHLAAIATTLFLFYVQDIKNGMAYAAALMLVFGIMLVFTNLSSTHRWRNLLFVAVVAGVMGTALLPHIQKNDSWRTLIADTKVAVQLDQYQQWKYAGAQGYPNNEFGKMVSVTNYERAAWFVVGLKLAKQTPLGYGLIEDSFKKMAKARWPEVSPNLSHSHSGWLDVVLAVGVPGTLLLLGALIVVMRQARNIPQPWARLAFWPLLANLLLWCTTEVSATVTFASLIFWVALGAGLTLFKEEGNHDTQNSALQG